MVIYVCEINFMQIKLSGLPTGIVVVRLACVHASLRTRHRVDYIIDDVCLGACVRVCRKHSVGDAQHRHKTTTSHHTAIAHRSIY